MNEKDLIACLRLSRSENVGAITYRRCIELFGSAQEALKEIPKMTSRMKRSIKIASEDDVLPEVEFIKKHDGSFCIYGTDDYPKQLAALDDSPPVLMILGHGHLLHKKCFAIVGTRNASAQARLLTQDLARSLSEAGCVIVSGMARGIDTAAHQGALEGGTIAVLAGGIDHIYPPENEELYHSIVRLGALVSEMPVGSAPRPQSFPRRNRIISGLSRGVLVVEAPLKSGSIITANYAAEQGRDVFAIPGSPLDPRSGGPNKLLREGAILVERAADILDHLEDDAKLSETPPPQTPSSPAMPKEQPDEQELHSLRQEIETLLSPTPIKIDVLIRETGANYQKVSYVLLALELEGRITYHGGQKVSLLMRD